MLVTEMSTKDSREDTDLKFVKIMFLGTKEEAREHIKTKDGDFFEQEDYKFEEFNLIPIDNTLEEDSDVNN